MRKHRIRGGLTDEAIALYRAAAQPVDVDEWLTKLNDISTQHNVFFDLDVLPLAKAVSRAWFEDALVLAATPASSAAQGLSKANYLEACLQAWIIPNARSQGHENAAGILAVAARRERDRWGERGSWLASIFGEDRVESPHDNEGENDEGV